MLMTSLPNLILFSEKKANSISVPFNLILARDLIFPDTTIPFPIFCTFPVI